MGVMSCSRRGCPRVMCDTHIHGIGYVCPDCQTEFKKWLEKHETFPKTEEQIAKYLRVFMETEVTGYDDEETMSVNQFFSNHTR